MPRIVDGVPAMNCFPEGCVFPPIGGKVDVKRHLQRMGFLTRTRGTQPFRASGGGCSSSEAAAEGILGAGLERSFKSAMEEKTIAAALMTWE